MCRINIRYNVYTRICFRIPSSLSNRVKLDSVLARLAVSEQASLRHRDSERQALQLSEALETRLAAAQATSASLEAQLRKKTSEIDALTAQLAREAQSVQRMRETLDQRSAFESPMER